MTVVGHSFNGVDEDADGLIVYDSSPRGGDDFANHPMRLELGTGENLEGSDSGRPNLRQVIVPRQTV